MKIWETWGHENAHYLDCGGGCIGEYTSKTHQLYMLMYNQLHHHRAVKKKKKRLSVVSNPDSRIWA